MEKKNIEKVMKNVEVLMVKKEVVDGRMVKTIKMMELEQNVLDYLDLTTSDKVKEAIKEKIRESKVFGMYDVDDLWYKWDDFLEMWRKKRTAMMKKKREEEKEKEELVGDEENIELEE